MLLNNHKHCIPMLLVSTASFTFAMVSIATDYWLEEKHTHEGLWRGCGIFEYHYVCVDFGISKMPCKSKIFGKCHNIFLAVCPMTFLWNFGKETHNRLSYETLRWYSYYIDETNKNLWSLLEDHTWPIRPEWASLLPMFWFILWNKMLFTAM